MKHSYETYSNSFVTLVNAEGILLGSNRSERHYQMLGKSFIQEWENSKYDRKDIFFYKKDKQLFFDLFKVFMRLNFMIMFL